MKQEDFNLADYLMQKYVDEVRRRKLTSFIEIQKNKGIEHQKKVAYVKTPVTDEEMRKMFPFLYKMLNRDAAYMGKKEQLERVKQNTQQAHQPKEIPLDAYNKTIADFYEDLDIKLGREYVVDGDKLGKLYVNPVEVADLTVGELLNLAQSRKKNGVPTIVDGDLLWRTYFRGKEEQLNKKNNVGK